MKFPHKHLTLFLLLPLLLISSDVYGKKRISYGNAIIGWGEPQDRSTFYGNTAFLKNGSIGVFTFDRRVYQYAEGLNAFPDGGSSKYLVDKAYIATYDLKTKEVKILREYNNLRKKSIEGAGRFKIKSSLGDKIIISQNGQLDKNYKYKTNYYWLNIDTGELTLIPLIEELTNINLALDGFNLISDDGTILVNCHPIGKNKYDKHGTKNKQQPEKILVIRYPSKEIKIVVKGYDQQYGLLEDNELFYYKKNTEYARTAFNIQTRKYKNISANEYFKLSENKYKRLNKEEAETLHFGTHYSKDHGSRRLNLGRRINGKWEITPLDIGPEDIAPITHIEGLK